jgi:hypothetical protein
MQRVCYGRVKTTEQLRDERDGLLLCIGLICLGVWAIMHFCGDTVPTYHAPVTCTYARPC